MSSNLTMNHLPVEVLSHVSVYLDPTTLFRVSFQTCRRLSSLFQSSRGVHQLDSSANLTTGIKPPAWDRLEVFPAFALKFQGLHSLTLRGSWYGHNLESPLAWPSSLRHIAIPTPHLWLDSKPMDQLFPNLVDLQLDFKWGNRDSRTRLGPQWVATLPASLLYLGLGQLCLYPPLLDFLPEHCRLERLKFGSTSFVIPAHLSPTLEELCLIRAPSLCLETFPPLPELRTLKIRLVVPRGPADPGVVIWPSRFILPKLTTLSVSFLRLSSEALSLLPPGLTRLSTSTDVSRIDWALLPRTLTNLKIGARACPQPDSFQHFPPALTKLVMHCAGNHSPLKDLPPGLTHFVTNVILDSISIQLLPVKLERLEASMFALPPKDLGLLPDSLRHLTLFGVPSFSIEDILLLPRNVVTLHLQFESHAKPMTDCITPMLPPSLESFTMNESLIITGIHVPIGTTELSDTNVLDSLLNSLPSPMASKLRSDPHLFKNFSNGRIGGMSLTYELWNLPPTVTRLHLLGRSEVLLKALPPGQVTDITILHSISDLSVDDMFAQFGPHLKSLHLPSTLGTIALSLFGSLSPMLTQLCLPKTEIALDRIKNTALPPNLTSLTVRCIDVKAAKFLTPLKSLTYFQFLQATKIHATHILALPRTLRHLRLGRQPRCETCQYEVGDDVLGADRNELLSRSLFSALPPSLETLKMSTSFGISSDQLRDLKSKLKSISASFVSGSLDGFDLDGLTSITAPDVLPGLIKACYPLIEIESKEWRLPISEHDFYAMPSSLTRLTLNNACPGLTGQNIKLLARELTVLELPETKNLGLVALSNFPPALTRLRISSNAIKSQTLKLLPPTLLHLHLSGDSSTFPDYPPSSPQLLQSLLIDAPASISDQFIMRLPKSLLVLRLGNCGCINATALQKSLPPSLTYVALYKSRAVRGSLPETMKILCLDDFPSQLDKAHLVASEL